MRFYVINAIFIMQRQPASEGLHPQGPDPLRGLRPWTPPSPNALCVDSLN